MNMVTDQIITSCSVVPLKSNLCNRLRAPLNQQCLYPRFLKVISGFSVTFASTQGFYLYNPLCAHQIRRYWACTNPITHSLDLLTN